MRYTLETRTIGQAAGRSPKTYPAVISAIGATVDATTITLAMISGRTEKHGESYRLHMQFTAADMEDSLMAAFVGHLLARMSPEMQNEADRVAVREYARMKGLCGARHGTYWCVKEDSHADRHANDDGTVTWGRGDQFPK